MEIEQPFSFSRRRIEHVLHRAVRRDVPEWWRADTGGGYLRAGIIEGATALRRSFYHRVSYRRRNRARVLGEVQPE